MVLSIKSDKTILLMELFHQSKLVIISYGKVIQIEFNKCLTTMPPAIEWVSTTTSKRIQITSSTAHSITKFISFF